MNKLTNHTPNIRMSAAEINFMRIIRLSGDKYVFNNHFHHYNLALYSAGYDSNISCDSQSIGSTKSVNNRSLNDRFPKLVRKTY